MGALELDRLSWPEVKAELEGGRDAVVIALGATEQHGPHPWAPTYACGR